MTRLPYEMEMDWAHPGQGLGWVGLLKYFFLHFMTPYIGLVNLGCVSVDGDLGWKICGLDWVGLKQMDLCPSVVIIERILFNNSVDRSNCVVETSEPRSALEVSSSQFSCIASYSFSLDYLLVDVKSYVITKPSIVAQFIYRTRRQPSTSVKSSQVISN